MSGFAEYERTAPIQAFSHSSPGQNYPQHCPQSSGPLGPPLTIREVGQLIGCSAWTVRQRYVPQGLPHLRSGPQGKLIFFRDQVIDWILKRQHQKGGIPK